ncbi:MAG: septal ring lytic transglycosylase RlpA family protein, partial [Hyphococcus sp.]
PAVSPSTSAMHMDTMHMRTFRSCSLLLLFMTLLAACSTSGGGRHGGPSAGAPHYKVGKPYKVNGRWYHPREDADYEEVGIASWYGRDFHGRKTANGEIFDMNRLSAAHTTLPMPSLVEVTNLKNGRDVVVRVNDRGPFAKDRVIDLSREAARRLGFEKEGLTSVRVRYLGRAPLLAKAPKDGASPAQSANILRRPPAPTPSAEPAVTTAPAARASTEGEATGVVPASFTPSSPSNPAQSASARRVEPPLFDPPSLTEPATADANPMAYVIRVAALSQLANIEALKKQLEAIGPLRLTRVESENGTALYRISMGPFASLNTATTHLKAVRDAGYSDAGIVALQP